MKKLVLLATLLTCSTAAAAQEPLTLDCLVYCCAFTGGWVGKYSIVVDLPNGRATISSNTGAVTTYAGSDADAVYVWAGNAVKGRINRITGTGQLNLNGQPNDLFCNQSRRLF
jgi:hypothetical protein